MASHPLLWIDAFTRRPLTGNPCAVVLDADPLDDATLQAVAREMNLSETAFVLPSERADLRARYFTTGGEIPMAGHPTVATIFALLVTGRLALQDRLTRVTIELPAGILPVEVESRDGRVGPIVMTQRAPEFLATLEAAEVLPVFGLEPGDALDGAPVQVVSTGTPQLMVPLRDAEALARARPDPDAYARLRERVGFFSAHLFRRGGFTSEGATSARHFGVPPAVGEDPFTGSATGAMAAWLWRHGLLDAPRFVAEQGHAMGRPGRASVEVLGPPDAIEGVRVGGHAALVLRGDLIL